MLPNPVPVGSTSLAAKASFTVFGIVGFLALLTIYLGVYSIDQGEVGIIKRNGAAIGVAAPGLHVKIPYIVTVT